MPADVVAVRPSPELSAAIANHAALVEQYLNTDASIDCGRFYLLVEAIGRSQPLVSMLSAQLQQAPEFGKSVLRELAETRALIEGLARVCAGLDAGRLELAAWQRDGEPTTTIKVGVWPAGTVPKLPTGTELFPLAPVLLIVGVGVVVSGAIALDLFAAAKLASSRAEEMRAQTDNVIVQSIANAPPDQRAGLADAYAKAQRAAADGAMPGWLSRFGQGLANLAADVVNAQASIFANVSEWAPWAVLALLLMSGGRRHRA